MAGSEMRTIVWLIEAISIPIVVLISTTHLYSSFTRPTLRGATVLRPALLLR